MDETNSYKKLKKVNSVLPNIKYNYTDIKYSGEKNNSNFNKEDYKELKNIIVWIFFNISL